MKIVSIVGARPHFMKLFPVSQALKKSAFEHVVVHTGQHYNRNLSQFFFEDLGLDLPEYNLGVGSMPRNDQINIASKAIHQVLKKEKPDLVLVYGDTNSTLAGALAARHQNIFLAHIEAGLRSFDHSMPEEINRIETDRISTLLFASEKSGIDNIMSEQLLGNSFLVGDLMVECLIKNIKKASNSGVIENLGLEKNSFVLSTLHRPSNVDSKQVLSGIISALLEISQELPVVLPAHPRLVKHLNDFGLGNFSSRLKLIEPLGYLDFIKLLSETALVITDSGSLQSESAFLEKKCITLRYNTERPLSVETGFNILAGNKSEAIKQIVVEALNSESESLRKIPEEWDGKAAKRIVSVLEKFEK